MKFSVGYQPRRDNLLLDAITENKAQIDEIYFPWDGFANGRNGSFAVSGQTKDEFSRKRADDFEKLNKLGLNFNLLLNGNCYGKDALSRDFYYRIGNTLDELKQKFNLTTVTTTSPIIAKFIKQNFDDISVRASVNMEIGVPEGIDYLSEYFDSFYLKREYNRNFEALQKMREFCDKNGKQLFGLANSGCLNFCSARTFHDNLVSHENEIIKEDNAYHFEGLCYTYLKNPEKRKNWLSITNFIRPEDVHLYEELFDGLKLATRASTNASRIIRAYTKGSFSGAVTDLLEPNHGAMFYPSLIENSLFPTDFASVVGNCDKNCTKCDYCKFALNKATINLE